MADIPTDDTGLAFTGEGTYGGMPLKAKGHTGHRVLSIRDETTPFPVDAEIRIGDTAASLEGTLNTVGFKGIDLKIKQLSGKTMEDMY